MQKWTAILTVRGVGVACNGMLVTGVHTQWSREYTLPPSQELDKFVAVVFLAYAILI